MNIGIMPHTKKPEAVNLAKKLINMLKEKGISPWVEKCAASILEHPELGQDIEQLSNSDILIVLGGDGALLNAARLVAAKEIPILGVNVGHLGFLTELEASDIDQAVEKIINRDYQIEERMFIDAKVFRDGSEIVTYRALNDIVITRGTFARIICLSTYVDAQHVIDYMADGIIVSTPTGSTAYSLSAGGPIVEPLLNCLIITPICPHTLAARSVIARSKTAVKIIVDAPHEDVMLTIDGQLGFRLKSQDEVYIEEAPVSARFVKLQGRNFFEILHNRLKTPRI